MERVILKMSERPKRQKKKLKIFAISAIIICIALLVVVWFFRCNLTPVFSCGGVTTDSSDEQSQVLGESTESIAEKAIWWDGEYAYAKSLTITNLSPITSLNTEENITASFDHQTLVNQDKSLKDGDDLHLVYFKNGQYSEVPFELINPNTNETTLSFKLLEELNPLETNDFYCLYYGNQIALANTLITVNTEEEQPTLEQYSVKFNPERLNPVQSSTNRKWILKDTADYGTLELKLEVKGNEFNVENAIFEIEGEQLTGGLERTSNNEFSSEIDISNLEPGNYLVKSYVITTNGVQFNSPVHELIVSYPLYVTWSMDWEGMDSLDSTLEIIDNFSNKHGVPVIQLWNPRAHMVLNSRRLNQLLDWLKNREAQGDQIGLHMHMFTDMVAETGIKPKNTPNWAAERNKSGSDTPAFVYSYEEHMQMLEWALKEFEKQGLETPKIYRVGGWMMDKNLMKALDDSGFVIDTSGRTKFSLGEYKVKVIDTSTNTEIVRNATDAEIQKYLAYMASSQINPDTSDLPNFVEYKVNGLWDLASTTKPYQVSANNINSSAGLTLDIWEFPNNGADSWRFGKDELLQRFNENFYGEPLDEMQVLTYLTHPHSIFSDMKKLEPTFDHIDQFNAKLDNGPVIYSTFKEPYKQLTGEDL